MLVFQLSVNFRHFFTWHMIWVAAGPPSTCQKLSVSVVVTRHPITCQLACVLVFHKHHRHVSSCARSIYLAWVSCCSGICVQVLQPLEQYVLCMYLTGASCCSGICDVLQHLQASWKHMPEVPTMRQGSVVLACGSGCYETSHHMPETLFLSVCVSLSPLTRRRHVWAPQWRHLHRPWPARAPTYRISAEPQTTTPKR